MSDLFGNHAQVDLVDWVQDQERKVSGVSVAHVEGARWEPHLWAVFVHGKRADDLHFTSYRKAFDHAARVAREIHARERKEAKDNRND